MRKLITHLIVIACALMLVMGCGRRLTDPIESLVEGDDADDSSASQSIVLQLLVSSGSQSAIPGLLGKQAIPSATSYLLKNQSSAGISSADEELLYVGLVKQDNLVRTILGSLFGSDEEDSCDPFVLAKLTYDETISLSICSGSYLFMVVKVASIDNLSDYEVIAMGTKEINVASTIDSIFKLDIDANGSLLISNYEELITTGALVETNESVPYYKAIDGNYEVTIDFAANFSGENISALAKNTAETSTEESGSGNKDDYKLFTVDIAQEVASDGTLGSGLIAQSSLTSSFLNGSIDPIKVPFVDSGCFRFDLEYRIPYGASGTCEKIINFNSSFACFTEVISSIYDAGGASVVGAFQVVETMSGENCPVLLENQFVNANGVFHMTKKGDPATTFEEAQVAITEASTQATVQIPTKSYSIAISDLAKASWCYDTNYNYSQMSEDEVKELLLTGKLISSSDATELSADIGVSAGTVQFTAGSINETIDLQSNYGYAYAYEDFMTDPIRVSGGCYSSKNANNEDILSCYINAYSSPNYTAPYCAIYATFTTDSLAKADLGITPPPTGTIAAASADSKGQYINVTNWIAYKNFSMSGDCSAYPEVVNLYNATEAYLKVEKNSEGLITFSFNDPNGNLIYANKAQINDDYWYYKCDDSNSSFCTSISIDKNYYYISVYAYNYYYYSSSNNCNLNLYLSSDHNFSYTPVALSDQVYKATLQESNQWGGKDYWVDPNCDTGDYQAFFGTDSLPTDIFFNVTLDAETKTAQVAAEINKSNTDTSDDKEITASATLELSTWDVLYGKTSYWFGNYNSPTTLTVNLSNGTTTSATLSVSGSLTLDDQSNSKYPTYQYFSMYYSRYDNYYYNYCYISLYPSKIEKQ